MTGQRDQFFHLENITLAKIHDVFEWTHKHTMRTDFYFWERNVLREKFSLKQIGGSIKKKKVRINV